MYKQLLDGCEACKITLSLTQCHRERLIGLTSILYLNGQNCCTLTMVKTSTWHLSENTQDAYAEMQVSTMLILSVQQIRIRSSCYICVCMYIYIYIYIGSVNSFGYRISFLFLSELV